MIKQDVYKRQGLVSGGGFPPAPDRLAIDVQSAAVPQKLRLLRALDQPFFIGGTAFPVGADDLLKGFPILIRQIKRIVRAGADAVSYTHLDVYKRQRYS